MNNISVCIPTYNRKDYLKRAIESVLYQLKDGDEIVIQDNASTDGTDVLVSDHWGSNKKVKYFRNSYNLGPTLNFGEVVASSSTDYILILTDDDYLLTNAVESVRTFFDKNKILAFKTAYFTYNEKSKTGIVKTYFKRDMVPPNIKSEDLARIYHSAHVFSGLCFKKSLFDKSEVDVNGANWYPSMLMLGKAFESLGYLSEPVLVHTWENETFWGIDPSKRVELNNGQLRIILFLRDKNYLNYEQLRLIIFEHFKIWSNENNDLILDVLNIDDKKSVKRILSDVQKTRRRIKIKLFLKKIFKF